jgi:CII-binding regulator of phage lambda lysogenization HflD
VTENEAELENAAILEELKSRLAKSETAAETAAQEYANQLTALKQRLSEANTEYMRIEEHIHAKDETIEQLEIQVKDLIRSKRDQENIYEAEVSFHHSPCFVVLANASANIENCGSAGKGGTPG